LAVSGYLGPNRQAPGATTRPRCFDLICGYFATLSCVYLYKQRYCSKVLRRSADGARRFCAKKEKARYRTQDRRELPFL